MLNLHDLSISDLQSYCDGLKEAVEILEETTTITDFNDFNARYLEAQSIIKSRFAELLPRSTKHH